MRAFTTPSVQSSHYFLLSKQRCTPPPQKKKVSWQMHTHTVLGVACRRTHNLLFTSLTRCMSVTLILPLTRMQAHEQNESRRACSIVTQAESRGTADGPACLTHTTPWGSSGRLDT